MTNGPALPKRLPGGYRITEIILEVEAHRKITQRILREVRLPAPPGTNVNEMQLAQLTAGLVTQAEQALRLLRQYETAREASSYDQPRYERIQIKVLAGGRLVGRVNGAQQIFNQAGRMTSPGIMAHPDNHTGRSQPRDGKK